MKKISLFLFISVLSLVYIYYNSMDKSKFKSVIIITIDTLRADHLSCYGYKTKTTPYIDDFAQKGVLFKWAFSASAQTAPSHVSIFTGKYPGFHSVGTENFTYKLSLKALTLAELCVNKGMKTAAIVSNPVLDISLGLNQGFNSYDDSFNQKELNRKRFEQTAEIAVDKAISKLENFKKERFFLWLHLQDPHGPYLAPKQVLKSPSHSFGEKSHKIALPFSNNQFGYREIPLYQKYKSEHNLYQYIARYDNEIAYMDQQLNRLFLYIKKNNLDKDTLVVITADHGEALGEDSIYFAHGHSVGIDQVRVPLIFVGNGIKKNIIIDDFSVSNIDIFSTIKELLGIEVSKKSQSTSLVDILTGDSLKKEYPIYFESESQRGIILGSSYLRRDRKVLEKGDVILSKNRTDKPWKNGKIFLSFDEQYLQLFKRRKIPPQKMQILLNRFCYNSIKAFKKKIKTKRNEKNIIKKESFKKLKTLGYLN